MDIFRICLVGVVLVVLLSFRFRKELSLFEINRLAETNRKYKLMARFLKIYPGILVLTYILALISAILLVIFAAQSWGLWGGLSVSFAAIIVALLMSKLLSGVAQHLIANNFTWFNKYFAWAEMFGRIRVTGDDLKVSSEDELLHIIDSGEFMNEHSKNLIKNAIKFNTQTASDIMTPRDKVVTVNNKDSLTPKVIDDLYNSGHHFFPVIQGNLDKTVGILYLDDILPLGQDEKVLTDVMQRCPSPIDFDTPLDLVLRQMSETQSNILLVAKGEKTVGLVTLSDMIKALLPVRQNDNNTPTDN